MTGRIFISYSSADRGFAYRLGTDLRATGIDLWLDQIDIRPGDVWEDEQERALASSDCVLVILTPAALSSRSVANEIDHALAAGKAILPVLRIPCELPPQIRAFKHVDFTTDYSTALHDLRRALMPSASATISETSEGGSPGRLFVIVVVGLTGALYGAICEWLLCAPYIRKHGLGERILVQKSLAGALIAGLIWAATGAVCGANDTALKLAFVAAVAAGIAWIVVDRNAYVGLFATGFVVVTSIAALAAVLLRHLFAMKTV
jgi:hypothetical protein